MGVRLRTAAEYALLLRTRQDGRSQTSTDNGEPNLNMPVTQEVRGFEPHQHRQFKKSVTKGIAVSCGLR